MPNNVIDIDLDEVSFVGKGANQEAHVVLMKRAPAQKRKGERMPTPKELQKLLDELQAKHDTLVKTNETLTKTHEELVKTSGKAVTDIAELTKKLEKLEKKEPAKKEDVPESVQKVLDEQTEQLKKQDIALAKMKDDNLTKEWLAKALEVGFIGKTDEVGALLKTIAGLDLKAADGIMGMLKAAQAKIETGELFKEFGSGGEGGGVGVAAEKLDKLAKAYASEKEITFEKAYTHIINTQTDLYKQYREEQSSGGK